MINRRSFCLSLAAALPAAFGQQRPSGGNPWSISAPIPATRVKGIYVSRFAASDGKLSPPELAAETINPSFVALHPKGQFLYAVGETNTFQDQKTGFVAAFSIDRATGKLKLLNQLSSRGGGPCHLVVDRTGKNLLVANYGTGSVACFPLKPDGSMAESSAFIQHAGSGPNRSRQQGPHAHQVVMSPDNRFAFVPDLGLDSIMIYRFDPAKGTLTPHDPPFAKTAPGSGPRHMAFHPKGRFAYVICEMGNSVTAFSYDAAKGVFKELQTETTLPKDFKGDSSTAEIEVHPNGRFLYGSNRRARQHREVLHRRGQGDDDVRGERADSGKNASVFRHRSVGPLPDCRQRGIRQRGGFQDRSEDGRPHADGTNPGSGSPGVLAVPEPEIGEAGACRGQPRTPSTSPREGVAAWKTLASP